MICPSLWLPLVLLLWLPWVYKFSGTSASSFSFCASACTFSSSSTSLSRHRGFSKDSAKAGSKTFFKIFFFLNVSHLKSLYWICYSIASVLSYSVFGQEACGILAPLTGMESVPPASEGKVLTTGLAGKSLSVRFNLAKSEGWGWGERLLGYPPGKIFTGDLDSLCGLWQAVSPCHPHTEVVGKLVHSSTSDFIVGKPRS